MTDIANAMNAAATGLRAQTARMRIIAENLANAQSTAATPGQDPYRRQVPIFRVDTDRESGVRGVKMERAMPDRSDFRLRFEPGHPAADAQGYVRLPNVNSLVEAMDMREAQRAYEANLNVIESARSMMTRTLDVLRR
jgi:flagellar basal-body rod protein FlgC